VKLLYKSEQLNSKVCGNPLKGFPSLLTLTNVLGRRLGFK
jgi:hypothetical protein